MFEHLENVLCNELHMLEEKYQGEQEISSGDLQKADLIFHALKSMATFRAMSDQGDGSYARGRSRTTGRYISREGGNSRGSYAKEMIDPYYDRRF